MDIDILVPLRSGVGGGTAKFLQHLVARWLEHPRVEHLRVYLPDTIHRSFSLPAEIVRLFPGKDWLRSFRRLRAMAEADKPDVVFIATGRSVHLPQFPVVTLLDNVEPLQSPHYSLPLLWRGRLLVYRREYRLACRRTNRVLTVSHYMQRQITTRLGVDPGRIDVVRYGFDTSEAAGATPTDEQSSGRYLFTAGVLAPYRGTEDLLHALGKLVRQRIPVPRLMIAGSPPAAGSRYVAGLRRLAAKLRIADHVQWLGLISREEMTHCYKECLAFVFTSRAESISNIVLESMGHGCVCISCDHDPMPEIYGDSAIYYPWGDSGALVGRIQEALAMSDLDRQLWQERAKARIKQFTWEQTAQQTLDSLQRAARDFESCHCNS